MQGMAEGGVEWSGDAVGGCCLVGWLLQPAALSGTVSVSYLGTDDRYLQGRQARGGRTVGRGDCVRHANTRMEREEGRKILHSFQRSIADSN